MIGNAVPPRLAYEVARSIASALQGLDLSLTATKHLTPKASTPVLVGYYKSDRHKRLILKFTMSVRMVALALCSKKIVLQSLNIC